MFRNLLSRLFSDAPDAPPLGAQDGEMAIAALLIRVARADDRYTPREHVRIEQILAQRGGLDSVEAAEGRIAAEMIEAEAPDTVRLTRCIKARVPLEDRMGVIGALWKVVYADGHRDPEEEAMVRLTAGLLGVPDRDSALARQRALAEMGELDQA